MNLRIATISTKRGFLLAVCLGLRHEELTKQQTGNNPGNGQGNVSSGVKLLLLDNAKSHTATKNVRWKHLGISLADIYSSPRLASRVLEEHMYSFAK